uniref:BPTI/Kunitz inhibitor domain-containing protein n=1 Tax=Sinocyclocheilus grahami TaxID=75366 RepID=A0A672L872_SINGR
MRSIPDSLKQSCKSSIKLLLTSICMVKYASIRSPDLHCVLLKTFISIFFLLIDVCQLKLDAGTCSNFSMKWYFEVRSGECVQFWYGGCDGNSNRFDTQEDCEIRSRCFLEKDSGGACGSYLSRWYYSQQTKKCMHFWYGGCGGNENRFLTEDECFRQCVSTAESSPGSSHVVAASLPAAHSLNPPAAAHSSPPYVCQLKLDAGTCSNFSMKWYFEVRSGECVQFWYGGCDGNSNRFNTQEDCEIRCLRAKKYLQTSKL